jgi:PAS domain S-box-containing protein
MVSTFECTAVDVQPLESNEARAKRLVRVLGTIRTVLWMVDEEGSSLAVSDPVHALLGLTPAEIIAGGSALWWSLVHDDEREAVADALEGFFQGRRCFDVEFRMQRRDGAWIWLHARAVAAQGHGESLYAELVVTDVTAQRLAERKQQWDRERLRMLVGGSPIVACSRRTTGNFAPTFVSENVTAIFGYTPKQFVGSTTLWTRIVHPDDRARMQAAVRSAYQKGRESCEYRVLHKRGDYRWIRDEILVMPSAAGRPREVISFWCDLSDRKRWEHACQHLEANVRLLTARGDDAMLLCSGGRIAYANQAFADAFDIDQGAELVGLDVLEQVEPRDRGALATLLGQADDVLTPSVPVPLRWMKKRGGSVTLSCHALPSTVHGEPAVLVMGTRA